MGGLETSVDRQEVDGAARNDELPEGWWEDGWPEAECLQYFLRAQQRAPGSREEGISRQECWY